MKKITLFTLTSFIILFTQSSCRKVYDYIHDHPDGHESLCRITQIRVLDYAGVRDTFDITYNAQGDPVTMLGTSPYHVYSNVEQYFRYDHFGRLSVWLWTYINSEGVLVWHKYGYPRSNFVTDTVFDYTGTVDGPAPNAVDAPFSYTITGYTMDDHGRIAKVWSVPNDPQEPPQLAAIIPYDANGNVIRPNPDLIYDNKVNAYRTNKVWQFVYGDYSRNNVLRNDGSFTPLYNDFGLPLNIQNFSAYPYFLTPPFFANNAGPQLDLTYACAAPKGPINY